MIPLLFAAALAVSPAAVLPSNPDAALAACAPLVNLTVAPDGTPFRRLDELPPGVVDRAVWRTVNGCPMREVVYKGQSYYVGPSIPRLDDRPLTGSRMARRTYPVTPLGPDAR